MEKSTFTREYRLFLATLKDFRQKAGLSQIELAAKLDQSQSFVSKCERGERRIDLVQLRLFCQAFGGNLSDFVRAFEAKVASRKG